MIRRQCQNCRYFTGGLGDATGECRIRSVPQDTFPKRSAAQDCGEWQDVIFTPEQHERRELIREFAVAIVEGWYASANNIGADLPADAWMRAKQLADYKGQT